MNKLMPAKKYAEYIGLPYKKILQLAKIKGFPSLKIGEKKIYVLSDQADEWFRKEATKPLE